MELRRENVIAGDGGGKGASVVGAAGGEARLRGLAVVTVHEIEARAVGYAPPEGMGTDLPDLVPAHVRHLDAGRPALGRDLEPDDASAQEGQPRRGPLRALLEEHLLADAQSQERLPARGLLDRLPKAALFEAAHAVGHRALA